MSTNEITERVEDALTYPILTQQVDGQQPSTATQGVSIAGGSSIDSVAREHDQASAGMAVSSKRY
jgi:hypothetical protein